MKTESVSCATCPFFSDGNCHHKKNGSYPEVESDWWCSEHPLAPGQRDRIAEQIVLSDMAGILAARMVYDFGSLLKDAYRNADLVLAERAKGSE